MNYNKLLLFAIFINLSAVSAQVNITLSNPYEVVDASVKTYFNKGDEGMAVKIDGDDIIIQKFNTKKPSFTSVKKYEKWAENSALERITEFNDHYYVFYSIWDKKNEKEQLFVREIDFTKGEFAGPGKILFKVNGKIAGSSAVTVSWFSVGVTDKFDFQDALNDTKMLVYYRMKPEQKNDAKSHDIIGMHVFDENLAPVWDKEVTMPYTEKKMNNIDYSIDNHGNAYILTTIFNDNTTDMKKGGKDGIPNFHIELLKIIAGTGEVSITKMDLKDKFINKLWLYELPGDKLVCAGFYNTGKDLDNADGVVLFKIDQEGKISDNKSYEIPIEVMNQFVSERTQKKNEKKDDDDKAEFQDLELREMKVFEDGSVALIGEQHFVTSSTSTMNGRTSTTYRYHYNDILMTKIDAEGKLAWMKKIPKRQTGSSGRGGMGYQYLYGDKTHYLLFLDNEKNLNLPTNKVPAEHKDGAGGFLTAYILDDSNGSSKRTSILDMRDVKGTEIYQFNTERIMQTGPNEFVFESYKKKKEDILIKVVLQNKK